MPNLIIQGRVGTTGYRDLRSLVTGDSALKSENPLIKPVTSDHDLIELANIINVHLDGIYGLGGIHRPLGKGSYLILLGDGSGVGHWCAQYYDQYFDSMGEGPPTVLGNVKYNSKQYQGVSKSYCGIWCLLWLYSKQKNKPHLMQGFSDLDLDVI